MSIEELQEQLLQEQEARQQLSSEYEQIKAQNEKLEADNKRLMDYNNKLFARVTTPITEDEKPKEPLTQEQVEATFIKEVIEKMHKL